MSCVDSVSCVPRDNSAARNLQSSESFASILAAEVNVSQSQTAEITLVTAEGDTVTLSSSKSAELSFSTYNARGQVGASSAALSGMSSEIHLTSAFSFSVDGDLNKSELKDIRHAIRTIQKAATDILKGHEEKAEARTASLSRLDQIASIDADLEFNREVSIRQVSSRVETTELPAAAVSSELAPETQEAEPTEISDSVWTPDIATSTATAASATVHSHLSLRMETPLNSTAASAPTSSENGLWWFPSQDLWNILNTKDSAASPAVPEVASETPVTV